jgi:hypothetical protein
MKCTNATKVNRKSGGAEWRDLQFRGPLLEMFSTAKRKPELGGPTPAPVIATVIVTQEEN